MATSGGWSTIGTGAGGNPIYKYDSDVASAEYRESINTPEVQADKDRAQATRNLFTDLYNKVGTVVTNLNNTGRQEEAAQLRDAAERFARAGSRTGISSDQRVASLQKLAGSLRIQGQHEEGEREFKGIGESLAILNSIAGLDANALNQSSREASMSVSSSGSRSNPMGVPAGFSAGGVRSPQRTQNPVRTSAPATPTRPVNPYFQWRRENALASENNAARQSFYQRNQKQPSPFAGRDVSSGNNPARQWGEPITSGTGIKKPRNSII